MHSTELEPSVCWRNSDAQEFIWPVPGCSNALHRWFVGGWRSAKMPLKNMVFQGTVVGPLEPLLRGCPARDPCLRRRFEWFKEFENNASADSIAEAKKCQSELHNWSRANLVTFDPAKESVHIVSHAEPRGDSFELLGILLDYKLRMDLVVSEVVTQASWKLTTGVSMTFSSWCKCTNRRCSRSLSISPLQCITNRRYPETVWFLRECGLSDDELVHLISHRWRHAETSRFLVCCTDRPEALPRHVFAWSTVNFLRNMTSNYLRCSVWRMPSLISTFHPC